jgi:hypothetical protein
MALSERTRQKVRKPLSEDELAARFQVAWCGVHGYAMLWVEGSRKSRSLDQGRRMLRTLRPWLVTK